MLRSIIVDDEENIRYLIKKLISLSNLGIYVIDEASEGEEGLEMCMQLKPDIVLADIRMPGIDGLEMLRRIKVILPFSEVILISGYSDFLYAQKAIEYGALAYLLKPIEEEKLYNTLAKAKDKIYKRINDNKRIDMLKQEVKKLQSNLISSNTNVVNEECQNSNIYIEKALSYINENYCSEITLQDVAEKIFMNPTYFSQLFKKVVGRSFIDYLNDLRIKKAKSFLEIPEFKVSEIADMVGFKGDSYFIRVFKKYTGMTPIEYRSINKNQKKCN